MTFGELLAFSIAEFDRRQRVDLLGTSGFIATAEDLVIAKLEWSVESGSDRQLDDVAGILEITPVLDFAYIDRWTRALGLEAAWARVTPGDA